MKKGIVYFLSILMALSFVGCGGSSDKSVNLYTKEYDLSKVFTKNYTFNVKVISTNQSATSEWYGKLVLKNNGIPNHDNLKEYLIIQDIKTHYQGQELSGLLTKYLYLTQNSKIQKIINQSSSQGQNSYSQCTTNNNAALKTNAKIGESGFVGEYYCNNMPNATTINWTLEHYNNNLATFTLIYTSPTLPTSYDKYIIDEYSNIISVKQELNGISKFGNTQNILTTY